MNFPEKIDFPVTQEHLDNGSPQECCYCPVALAFNEKLYELGFDRDTTWSAVSGTTADVIVDHKIVAMYAFSQAAADIIELVDWSINPDDRPGAWHEPEPADVTARLVRAAG